MSGKGWYHDTTFESTSAIEYFEESPNTYECSWFGPFASFTAAKEDAIGYHLATKNTAAMALSELRAKRKSDWSK